MFIFSKAIVVDYKVRQLCRRPYPGHPHGCPNWNHKKGCPPTCPKIEDVFDQSKGFYIVWNEFDFGAHKSKMRQKHPGWSPRQIKCCLYWQGKARSQLEREIVRCLHTIKSRQGWRVVRCPEAMGMNVTKTMGLLGARLEWPPIRIARQVAIIGYVKG